MLIQCLEFAPSIVGRPKFWEISLPQFFVYNFIIQSQRDPIWVIWKSFSVAAEPLNTPDSHPHCHPTHCWEYQGFRGLAATLNDFQMAQMGSHCNCMIKSYPKNFGREIPKNLGRPIAFCTQPIIFLKNPA